MTVQSFLPLSHIKPIIFKEKCFHCTLSFIMESWHNLSPRAAETSSIPISLALYRTPSPLNLFIRVASLRSWPKNRGKQDSEMEAFRAYWLWIPTAPKLALLLYCVLGKSNSRPSRKNTAVLLNANFGSPFKPWGKLLLLSQPLFSQTEKKELRITNPKRASR